MRALVTNPIAKDYFLALGSRSLEMKPIKMVISDNFTFNYSMKKIPKSSKFQYETMLVESIESLINRMRWKLFLFKSSVENIKERNGWL